MTTRCEVDRCNQAGDIHITGIDRRTLCGRWNRCESHAADLLKSHLLRPPATFQVRPPAVPQTCDGAGWAHVDPELLVYKEGDDFSRLLVSEVAGLQRFWIAIGYAEAAVLQWRLERVSFGRPLTHDALSATICTLGAKLCETVIDEFVPDRHLFRAKLQIDQSGRVVAVDVRPSDAIVMAVVAKVPIFVSHDVLSKCALSGAAN